MKSAYEIAMEKLNAASAPPRKLTEAQKARLADIEAAFDARIAETNLSYDEKMSAAAPEQQEALGRERVAEIASLEEKREVEKESVWSEGVG